MGKSVPAPMGGTFNWDPCWDVRPQVGWKSPEPFGSSARAGLGWRGWRDRQGGLVGGWPPGRGISPLLHQLRCRSHGLGLWEEGEGEKKAEKGTMAAGVEKSTSPILPTWRPHAPLQ